MPGVTGTSTQAGSSRAGSRSPPSTITSIRIAPNASNAAITATGHSRFRTFFA